MCAAQRIHMPFAQVNGHTSPAGAYANNSGLLPQQPPARSHKDAVLAHSCMHDRGQSCAVESDLRGSASNVPRRLPPCKGLQPICTSSTALWDRAGRPNTGLIRVGAHVRDAPGVAALQHDRHARVERVADPELAPLVAAPGVHAALRAERDAVVAAGRDRDDGGPLQRLDLLRHEAVVEGVEAEGAVLAAAPRPHAAVGGEGDAVIVARADRHNARTPQALHERRRVSAERCVSAVVRVCVF